MEWGAGGREGGGRLVLGVCPLSQDKQTHSTHAHLERERGVKYKQAEEAEVEGWLPAAGFLGPGWPQPPAAAIQDTARAPGACHPGRPAPPQIAS